MFIVRIRLRTPISSAGSPAADRVESLIDSLIIFIVVSPYVHSGICMLRSGSKMQRIVPDMNAILLNLKNVVFLMVRMKKI
jgi:hypothetical protein